jgi:hypothetical protein
VSNPGEMSPAIGDGANLRSWNTCTRGHVAPTCVCELLQSRRGRACCDVIAGQGGKPRIQICECTAIRVFLVTRYVAPRISRPEDRKFKRSRLLVAGKRGAQGRWRQVLVRAASELWSTNDEWKALLVHPDHITDPRSPARAVPVRRRQNEI